jgi:hypothetical protein
MLYQGGDPALWFCPGCFVMIAEALPFLYLILDTGSPSE